MHNRAIQQMELGFNGSRATFHNRRQRRLARAAWWFDRMRQAVDNAFDRQSAPPARPEQIWFENSYRRPLAKKLAA